MGKHRRLITLALGSTFVLASCGKRSPTATLPVASVTITGTTNLTVGQTSRLVATMQDRNGLVLAGRVVSWSSSNTPAARITSSGLVTAVSAGSATITATSEGQRGTAQILVR